LEHPALPISKFTLFEGDLTLRCVTETKEILIPNVLEQGGKPTRDPHLKGVGFAIAVDKVDESTNLKIHFGSKTEVANVKLVDSKGETLENAPLLVRLHAGEKLDLVASFDAAKLPPGTAVKVRLRTRIDEVKVPFRFENLAVPAPPNKAEPSVAAWRYSDAAGAIPEGLVVHGRLKWVRRTTFDDNANMQVANAVAMQVDVTGPQAKETIAVGFQKADKAQTKPGSALT